MSRDDAPSGAELAATAVSRAPTHRGRWVRLGIAPVAVIAVAGLLLASPWSQPPARAEAPALLDFTLARAADIVVAPGETARNDLILLADAARTVPAPGDTGVAGTVQYVQTDTWSTGLEYAGDASTSGVTPVVVQTWTSRDGAQTVVRQPGDELGSNGRGLMAVAPAAAPSTDQTLPPGSADPDAVTSLGTVPAVVREALISLGGCEPGTPDTVRAACLSQEIVGLFSQHLVPPASAAAVWTAIADEPGFRSLGRVTDRAGRAGIGISVISSDVPEYRTVLIISSADGQLVGTEEILIQSDPDAGLQAPLVTAFSAILASTYTADRPQPR